MSIFFESFRSYIQNKFYSFLHITFLEHFLCDMQLNVIPFTQQSLFPSFDPKNTKKKYYITKPPVLSEARPSPRSPGKTHTPGSQILLKNLPSKMLIIYLHLITLFHLSIPQIETPCSTRGYISHQIYRRHAGTLKPRGPTSKQEANLDVITAGHNLGKSLLLNQRPHQSSDLQFRTYAKITLFSNRLLRQEKQRGNRNQGNKTAIQQRQTQK